MRRSIRIRVLVWILALLVPLTVAAAWLLVEVFGNRLLRDIDVALEEEAETIAALIEEPPPESEVQDLVRQIASETDLGAAKSVVVMRGGKLIAEAPPGAKQLLAANDPTLRVSRYDRGTAEGQVSVAIGVRPANAFRVKQRLRLLLAGGVPLTLLAMVVGLWVVIGRALAPLAAASRRLEAIDLDNLSARIAVTNPDDEVGRMVAVLNRMLVRLEGAVCELQRFTADAAHELRTPLTVLRTGLEVALSRDRSAEEYGEALRQALSTTDRMRHLAEELLTQSRLEAFGQPADATPVDLSEVLLDLVEAWEQVAAQRDVKLTVRTAANAIVYGNADDLYRLFNNLIDNALRHSPSAGNVSLTAKRGSDRIEVLVEDDGPGMLPQELERAFDRFYRADVQRPAAGSGLGLSIAQQVARMHGGSITLANREGGGCTVRVVLPCRSADPGDPAGLSQA